MTIAKNLQPSMSGGELAPALWARVDLAKYKTGFKLGQNMFIHPQGGISNRPGWYLIGAPKSELNPVRLFAMVASSDDAYVLEFGDQYVRFWRNGGPVMDPVVPASYYEVATPYSYTDVKKLKISQSNDVLTITHPGYAPRELTRYAHNNWTLTTISFIPTFTPPFIYSVAATIGYNKVPPADQSSPNGYIAKTYTYVVTAISGNGEESLVSNPYDAVNDMGYPQNYNTVAWNAVAGAARYNVYKQDNGYFGLIGTVPGGTTTFKDTNIKADLSDGPPQQTNPFTGGNNPGVSAFHQQRRFFAASTSMPQTIWGSQSSNFYNMSVSLPAKDADAVTFSIASQQLQRIQHLVPMGDLIVFTKSGEWKISGSNSDLITPASLSAKPQSSYGSSDVAPIVIGNQILFVQGKGNQVRDLGYKFDVDRYTGDDLSIMARHLMKKRKIVAWAWAQTPDSVIACVMDDGQVIALTYLREHEVWGWTRWKTQGFVEDVVAVPEGDYDAFYFATRRFINGVERRFIERAQRREFRSRSDCFFVDCGLTYDQPVALSWFNSGGETIYLKTAHGLVAGQQVELETRIPSLTDARVDGKFTIDRIVNANQFTLVDGPLLSGTPSGMDLVYRTSIKTVNGLTHLAGATVVGLADGAVVGDAGELVVSGTGTVTLQDPAFRIHLGLSYEAIFESLSLTLGDRNVAGSIKTVGVTKILVESTAGVEIGGSIETLQETFARATTDVPGFSPALTTGVMEVTPLPVSNYGGEVFIRQKYPLPFTLLSIIPEINYEA